MKRIAVTGGNGKAGRACVADLLDHGYEVLVLDRVAPTYRDRWYPSILVDLTDYGQTIDALSGGDGARSVDAVVHLAAIPAPRLHPNAHTFRNNTLSDYHVFEAARRLGIKNIVWASSETVLGLPFDTPPPYVPVDEEYAPRPESAYSLSKALTETMAQQFCRWDPEMKIIGLRFSNIMEPGDYARFPEYNDHPEWRKWNLWGYIDARDAAQAIRKGLEAPIKGAEVFIIANADTVLDRPNAELLAEFFPDVPAKREFGPNETLLSIEKAKRLLGYEPVHSWRNRSGE
ncbi:MAG: NAD(P)-dependent oxidoreductase [Capsulimonadales bacterium]|nr:NAD(P)-dependent oxidoreductase [Capsulimonadales bacterium]